VSAAERPRTIPALAAPAGLCALCRHGETIASARSSFLRCALSDTDPRYPRYPRLPVLECAGFVVRRADPSDPTTRADLDP
jgi:hypothetical protein